MTKAHALDLATWPIFHKMSTRGLKVDPKRIHAVRAKVAALRDECETWLKDEVGPEFNPSSPKCVAEWMEAQGMSGKRTKKTGMLSTNERMLALHPSPVLKKELEWRGHQKLISAFIDPLLEKAAQTGNVIHPKWRLTKVKSGRVAMEDPNLLAFPVRDELGRMVRDCFVARAGYRLISIDYSQIEPRITAGLSQDPKLLSIYQNNRDLYTETARGLFRLNGDPVDPFKHRLPAKTTTLGVLYGIGAQKLFEELQRVGCGEGDPFVPYFDLDACERLIFDWFTLYPAVARFVRSTVDAALVEGGYAKTEGERLRFLPALFLKGDGYPNGKLREEAERQAFNHRIQGTAQECMKEAMVRVDGADLPFYPLLQIHDELIGESPAWAAQDTAQIIAGIMETDFRGVRLKAEAKVAETWGGLK